MHTVLLFCQWLENTTIGASVRDSLWEFPVIETVHIFGIVLLVGSTSILDLRLLNLAFKEDAVSKLAHRFLPWTWTGFGIQVVTGLLLFSSEATKMYDNRAFQLKMLMILLAGVNALIFHMVAYRSVERWDRTPMTPLAAKCAGALGILLWFGVVAAGRWIAYV
ncbi:MAG TPA: DUF6644 family protein [Candidatus Acidoferrales bacterium]|nr:DUF6644 family protein [Candidatus Acidoferrales bacterium]